MYRFRGGIVKTSKAPTKTSDDVTKSTKSDVTKPSKDDTTDNDVTVIDDDDAIYDAETDTECDVIVIDVEKFDVNKKKTNDKNKANDKNKTAEVIDLESFSEDNHNTTNDKHETTTGSEVIYLDNC